MRIIDSETATAGRVSINRAFRDDVLRGLAGPQKAIPARWLYDRRGSELFEAITQLPEYYPSRTERGILADNARAIAEAVGPGRAVVEFGSGASVKTPLLLSAIQPAAYVPIDISGEFLSESAAALARKFPDLPVQPIEADFTRPVPLSLAPGARALGFFPGSTIGNLVPHAAVDLLRTMSETLGTRAQLLIGIDRTKSPLMLVPAYDDEAGVTAAFNLNLLHRINRELQGDIPVSAFRHRADWNDFESRIEMHLHALRDVRFKVAGEIFTMHRGESIHTENSTKYAMRDARLLLRAGGWSPRNEWTDRDGLFAVILAEAAQAPPAP